MKLTELRKTISGAKTAQVNVPSLIPGASPASAANVPGSPGSIGKKPGQPPAMGVRSPGAQATPKMVTPTGTQKIPQNLNQALQYWGNLGGSTAAPPTANPAIPTTVKPAHVMKLAEMLKESQLHFTGRPSGTNLPTQKPFQFKATPFTPQEKQQNRQLVWREKGGPKVDMYNRPAVDPSKPMHPWSNTGTLKDKVLNGVSLYAQLLNPSFLPFNSGLSTQGLRGTFAGVNREHANWLQNNPYARDTLASGANYLSNAIKGVGRTLFEAPKNVVAGITGDPFHRPWYQRAPITKVMQPYTIGANGRAVPNSPVWQSRLEGKYKAQEVRAQRDRKAAYERWKQYNKYYNNPYGNAQTASEKK